ncbi:uncharacterized protein LOC141673742 [Apium graveolens]|uniref:uncharacterized protein LOC141673742 n=1 Tax=Apium graveolens TaxID=4045 RepID=UPI003D7A4E9B
MGPVEDTIEISVDEKDLSKVLRIGSQLAQKLKEGLSIFLLANLDVFAWSHSDMVGIDPEIMCHRLNIDPKHKGVRQKCRAVSGDRAIALAEEVERLVDVGLIRKSFYPEWLTNPVLVKKPNGKWRTCVDFTDLNKACPKDSFSLPRIDQLVDAMAGHALLSFMDAYSGYNQILMYEPDQEHTSFITDRGLYCYIGMPFGLINSGATYQRLVNKMFKKQIGKTMEVYMDDMLVKFKRAEDHIADLAEMFHILRKYKKKLNPHKCVFGVESGKFLGFMVNHRGIEANPAKIKALLDMKSPTSVKQVQSLTGRIAALNRFVSKSSDRCKESRQSEEGERIFCGFPSRGIGKGRSKPPVARILREKKVVGCGNQAVELGQFDLEYCPRTEIKGQVLTDFILEFDAKVDDKAIVLAEPTSQGSSQDEKRQELPHPWWILHVDGAVNNNGSGARIILTTPEGHRLMSAIHFKFYATNNDVEYEALINDLKLALEVGAVNLIVRSDSELVVNQVNGGFQARGP